MLLLEGYRFVDVWSKGQTDGIGHQHLPEQGVKVFVGQDEGAFLEFVRRLAHLTGKIDVRAGVDKLLDEFQLIFVQVVDYQLQVVKQNSGCTSLRLLVCFFYNYSNLRTGGTRGKKE